MLTSELPVLGRTRCGERQKHSGRQNRIEAMLLLLLLQCGARSLKVRACRRLHLSCDLGNGTLSKATHSFSVRLGFSCILLLYSDA